MLQIIIKLKLNIINKLSYIEFTVIIFKIDQTIRIIMFLIFS